MATTSYICEFSDASYADDFMGIARRFASMFNTFTRGNCTVVEMRIPDSACDVSMLRDLAVRTCSGTFCCC